MKFLDYFRKKSNRNEKLDKKVTISDIASISPENPINKEEKIRVIYANAYTFETGYDSFKKLGIDLTIGNPLVLPKDISLEDSYSIISKVLDDNRANENCNMSDVVAELGRKLFDYKFTEIKTTLNTNYHITCHIPGPLKTIKVNECPDIEGVTDILFVDGDFSLIKKTNIASKNTNWYVPGVTQEKIDEIYAKRKESQILSQDK